MVNKKLLCGGGCCALLGVVLLALGVIIGGTIDATFAGAVDSMFIDKQKDSDGECIKCEDDDADEKCTPTCEEDQIRWFMKKTNPSSRRRWTDTEPDKYDYWVYTVTNPEEVVAGAKPKMDYVDKFSLYEISSFEQVGEVTDGKLEYFRKTNDYRVRDASKEGIEEANAILNTEITVPHVSYSVITNPDTMGGTAVHGVYAGGIQGFLAALGGMLGPMVPMVAPAFPMVETALGMGNGTVPADTDAGTLLKMEYQHGVVSVAMGIGMGGGVPDLAFGSSYAATSVGADASLAIPMSLQGFIAGCGTTRPLVPCGLELLDEPNAALGGLTPRMLALTDDEATMVFDGLYGPAATQTTQAVTIGTMQATWTEPLQQAKFGAIMMHNSMLGKFSVNAAAAMAGVGASHAYPMFIKTTVGKLMGVTEVDADGYLVSTKDKDGNTMTPTDGVLPLPASFALWQADEERQPFNRVLGIGNKDEKKEEKAFRFYHQYGDKQRCDVDLDCQAQAEYQTAAAAGDFTQCTADDKCTPLTIEGFATTGFMPGGTLFSGNDERAVNPFKEAEVYSYGLGKVVMKPAAVDFTKDGNTIKTHEWTLSKIYDFRENCDGSDPDNAVGLDCRLQTPKLSFYIGFQLASGALRPAVYASMPQYELEETSRTEELRKTAFYTEGPYHPREKVEFAQASPVKELLNIKFDTLMGRQVHGDKAIMYNVRINSDFAFPMVQDALVPVFVGYQFGTTNKEEHEALAAVQASVEGLQSFNPFTAMLIFGIILLFAGLVCIGLGMRSGGPKVATVAAAPAENAVTEPA